MNCPHCAARNVDADEHECPMTEDEIAYDIVYRLARCTHEPARQAHEATGTPSLVCLVCGATRGIATGTWYPSQLAHEAKELDAVG